MFIFLVQLSITLLEYLVHISYFRSNLDNFGAAHELRVVAWYLFLVSFEAVTAANRL